MARFIYPVTYNLSQGFGGNAAYYKQFGQLGHNGFDLAQPAGTPIKASSDGKIAWEGVGKSGGGLAGWMGAPSGIAVIIDHGDVYTGYAHMRSTIVSAGQSVKQGQVIGYVGSTGAATGPHVHFEFIAKPPNFSNGYAGRLNPSQFNVGGGDEDMPIPDTDNYYWRYGQDLAMRTRGRQISRDEFRKFIVGVSDLRAVEILSDDPEAAVAQNWQNVGRQAVKDKWDQQIYSLQDALKKSNTALEAAKSSDAVKGDLEKQLAAQIKDNEKLAKQVTDLNVEKETANATGNAVIRWLGELFNKLKGGK